MPSKRSALRFSTYAATSLLSATLLLTGCSNDEPEQASTPSSPTAVVEDRLLSLIPADTPYFFASRERMSEDDAMLLIEKLGTLDSIETQLADLEQLRQTTDDEAMHQFLDIMTTLLKTLDEVRTVEDYHRLGMLPNARSAIYGLGLLPAARMELHDEALFKAFFENLLTELPVDMQRAQLGDTEYWYTSVESPMQTLITIRDEQVVMGMLPSTAEQALLEQLFGITPPTMSLLQSGEMQQLEQRYNYSPYGSGRFSTKAIVREVIAPEHPASRALMALGGPETLDVEVCRGDIDRLTNLFPALVMGVHELSTDRITGSMRLATGAELADDLTTFTTAVPGLGSGQGIASLGIALDVQAVTRALQKYAGQVRTTPFTCPELQGINEAWNELGLLTNHPMTMMLGPALSGMNIRIDSLQADPMQPGGSGVMTFASPNAQGLISAVSMFVPQIATLNLQSNGDVKQVDPQLLPPEVPSMHAAMSDKSIILGVGLDTPEQLKSELKNTNGRSGLLTYGHLGSEIFAILAELSTQLPNTDGLDTAELLYMAELYEKTEFWIGIDGAGIEFGVGVELK